MCIGKTYVSVSQNFPDEHLLLQIRWALQPMWSKYFALQFLFNSVPCPDDSQKRHIFFNEPLESKVNRIQITTSIILLTHLLLQRPVLKLALDSNALISLKELQQYGKLTIYHSVEGRPASSPVLMPGFVD